MRRRSRSSSTIYIDVNQGYLYKLMKAAGDGPVRSLDQWMTEQSFTERHVDLETMMDPGTARYLSSLLNQRGVYFVVVNKKGLHFKYPGDTAFTIWRPALYASEPIDTSATGREKLVNTYDNVFGSVLTTNRFSHWQPGTTKSVTI